MSASAERQELQKIVRDAGLKATPSRLEVVRVLRAAARPLSHAEVADKLSAHGWDPATLYRNLTDLTQAGLVRRSDLGDHVWRFELVGLAHEMTAHPHFVCVDCGAVECLPTSKLVMPRATKRGAVEVQVRGHCADCL